MPRNPINNPNDILGVGRNAIKFAQVAAQASQDTEHRARQNSDMVAHRYQYFAWTTLFVAVLAAGEWWAFYERPHISAGIFYIWVGSFALLLLFGLLTWGYYLYLIFKHR